MASLAAGVVLAPAAFGFAGYQAGPYLGETTERDEVIRFRAGELQVKQLSSVFWADCKNGKRQRITVESGRTAIEDDRFELELTGPAELVVTVTGKLEGNEASGRIDAIVRPGRTVCTAERRWNADRQ